MSLIKTLRDLGDFDGTTSYYGGRDERLDELEELTSYNPRYSKELYSVKVVHEKFEDQGRWSNYETKVYEVLEDGEIAYFEYGLEVPATESQDGMDCSFHFLEVVPKEIIAVKYVPKN